MAYIPPLKRSSTLDAAAILKGIDALNKPAAPPVPSHALTARSDSRAGPGREDIRIARRSPEGFATVTLPPRTVCGVLLQVRVARASKHANEGLAAIKSALQAIERSMPGILRTIGRLNVTIGDDLVTQLRWHPDERTGTPTLHLGMSNALRANPVAPQQGDLGFPSSMLGIWGQGRHGMRGVADQVYDQRRLAGSSASRWLKELAGTYRTSKSHAKATAVAIHEIGHLLHALKSPDHYWNNRRHASLPVDSRIAGEVSNYALQGNPDEFVAEVFVGMVLGHAYSSNVKAVYEALGGPSSDTGAARPARPGVPGWANRSLLRR
jgi:hypothetical protein